MPRAGDQGKKGKRKGRNKQEALASAEPSAHGEEVKTPLDLAKVRVGGWGITGKAWNLEPGQRGCQGMVKMGLESGDECLGCVRLGCPGGHC